MARVRRNPHRDGGKLVENAPFPSINVGRVASLLAQCPSAGETPIVEATTLAPVAGFWIKDERSRMNLASFKALGAAYVIARDAVETAGETPGPECLSGRTYVTASAGNHGLSVAAGVRAFGAQAVVFIAATVPESFARRLQDRGAHVVRHGSDYAASMEGALAAARENDWTLLSDSSWDGYTEVPYILMEGYLQMADEAIQQCESVPTHIFLQAGVGGLAGAVAALVRDRWGNEPIVICVEPDAAPALAKSIEAGKAVFADGPDSIMGRLDCKEPSLIALNGLARDADYFATVTDDEVAKLLPNMKTAGLETTASGGAGVAAAMLATIQDQVGIDGTSRVLCFLSEATE